MSDSLNIKTFLGLKPSSTKLTELITALAASTSKTVPEVKSYPDAVYFSYYALGLSLLFKPINGYKPKTGLKLDDLNTSDLVVDGIDIYNTSANSVSGSKSKATYSTFPISPLVLSLVPLPVEEGKNPRPAQFEVKPETTGKEFVECMGEPARKGGGAGPSSGSIGIWCEWPRDGVMVEFGGEESRGPQAWERGKDAKWKIITIFPLKDD